MATVKQKEVNTPRKITTKTMLNGEKVDIEKLIAAEGKRLFVGDVFGIANRFKPGASDLGPYVKFLGSFRATGADGEVYESNVLILPKFLEEQLHAVMPNEGEAGGVEFAFRLTVKYDKDVATKYVYEAKSLLPPKEADQLAALAERVGAATKALPAPKG